MDLEELCHLLEEKAKEVSSHFSFASFENLSHYKIAKHKEVYHFTLKFNINLPKEILKTMFPNVPNDSLFKPWVEFDFDLNYYTNDRIKYVINRVFSDFRNWLIRIDMARKILKKSKQKPIYVV